MVPWAGRGFNPCDTLVAVRGLPPMIDVTFVPGVPALPDQMLAIFDEGERQRLQQLRPTGRPLFIAAHLAARMLVSMRITWAGDTPVNGPDVDEFGWELEPTGKPRLTYRDGRLQPLHISISHAGGLAVAAICEHGPIGVDVEHIETRRPLLPIAKRFYSPEEYARLDGCSADERAALFHQWWTRKEAVLKATGDGLRGGLSVRVDSEPDGGGWRRVDMPGREQPLFVRDLPTPDPGIVGAVALEGQPGVLQPVGLHIAPEWLADTTAP
jgi:4'-phosphopantetheinyl transferase